MSTYSTNFGNPAIEATNWNSLQKIMEGMPNNTAQLITPQHVRDAVYTTWEQGVFKILEAGTINYIGTDNGGSTNNFRYKMFLGKKELGLGNTIMDNTLLSSDTDIFFYNNKSDSNTSLQNTKISFLAGDGESNSFYLAPYLEASKSGIGGSSRIDLSIINPSNGGSITIDSDFIELGSGGWNINNLNGDLYPVVDGVNIGLTGIGNRIGTIYMASTIDYLNDLEFRSGTSSILFDTDGKITTESLVIKGDLKFENNPTDGFFLSSDVLGNVSWQPGKINTNGVTHGFISMADGGSDVFWGKRLADDIGVPAGYILTSSGTSTPFDPNFPNTTGIPNPVYKSISNISVPPSSNGLVLGSNGTTTEWVSSVTGADGDDGSIQFSEGGFLKSDNSKFHWDNINKRLGINMGTNPLYEIDVNGTVKSTTGLFTNLTSTNGTISTFDSTTGSISTLTSNDIGTSNIIITGTFYKGGLTSNGYVLTSDSSGFGSWKHLAHGNQYNIQFNDGSGGLLSDDDFSIDSGVLNTKGIKSSGHRIVNKRLLSKCVSPSTTYLEMSSTIDDHYVIFDDPKSYVLPCLTGSVPRVADEYTIRKEDCIDGRILHIFNLNDSVPFRKVVGRLYRAINQNTHPIGFLDIKLDFKYFITIIYRGTSTTNGLWHVISEGYLGSGSGIVPGLPIG